MKTLYVLAVTMTALCTPALAWNSHSTPNNGGGKSYQGHDPVSQGCNACAVHAADEAKDLRDLKQDAADISKDIKDISKDRPGSRDYKRDEADLSRDEKDYAADARDYKQDREITCETGNATPGPSLSDVPSSTFASNASG